MFQHREKIAFLSIFLYNTLAKRNIQKFSLSLTNMNQATARRRRGEGGGGGEKKEEGRGEGRGGGEKAERDDGGGTQ